jgi:hypothetical protein
MVKPLGIRREMSPKAIKPELKAEYILNNDL